MKIHLKYYGKNLDALYDLLSEQDGVEVEIINVDDENKYIKQVAKVMKKSKRQVENLIYRAKRALKTELDKEGFIYEEL